MAKHFVLIAQIIPRFRIRRHSEWRVDFLPRTGSSVSRDLEKLRGT